jgi:hypothetical protein
MRRVLSVEGRSEDFFTPGPRQKSEGRSKFLMAHLREEV